MSETAAGTNSSETQPELKRVMGPGLLLLFVPAAVSDITPSPLIRSDHSSSTREMRSAVSTR